MKPVIDTISCYFRFLGLACLAAWFGCTSNTHLRTQRILEPGEKAFTGSISLAAGSPSEAALYASNTGRLTYTGISGARTELGMLTGLEGGEAGIYVGYGVIADCIAGLELKKYITFGKSRPWKLGVQGEINYNPRYSYYESHGTTLHFKPSLTLTTSQNHNGYGGIHGLFASGRLKDYCSWPYTYYDPTYGYTRHDYHGAMVDYNFTSFGGGVTWGLESNGQAVSWQGQMDISLVHNIYTVDKERYVDYPYKEQKKDPLSLVLSINFGVNFFSPPPYRRYRDRQRPLLRGTSPDLPALPRKKEQVFDPYTGRPFKKKAATTPAPAFNPKTGKPVAPGKQVLAGPKFDPETGKPVWKKPKAPPMPEFKPATPAPRLPRPALKQKKFTPRPWADSQYKNIVALAKSDAKRSFNKLPWGACGGPVSCGAMGVAGVIGGMVAEIPGFIVGATGAAIASPLMLSEAGGRVAVPRLPKRIEDDPDSYELYRKAYKREIKRLRLSSIVTGQVATGLVSAGVVLVGLMLMLSY